ncbi:MAG: cell division protein SepF [Pseudonocardiaceae bacterium]
MSTLHRLKAYFGMVPAEEFDATEFDAASFDAAESDGYHAGYRSDYPDSDHELPVHHHPSYGHDVRHNPSERPATRRPQRAGFDTYNGGVPTPAGHRAPDGHRASPRVHPARVPSSSMDSRVGGSRAAESWATESWGVDAPVHGALAIDPATTDATHIDSRAAARQPVAPQPFMHAPRTPPIASDEAHPLARIVTLHPHSYNEARPIGERYREGNPVIINLTAMEDRDAKRLVDFAAGLAFALRGSIDKVTNKVFLLSPPNLDVSAEDRRRIAEGRYFA